MDKRITQALAEIKVPLIHRTSPPARILHRTSLSIIEAHDPQSLASELAKEREGRGFDSPTARPYRPLGEPQDLKGLHAAIHTEIKALENPGQLLNESTKLPYLSLSHRRVESQPPLPSSLTPLRSPQVPTGVRRMFKQEIAESYQRMRNVKAGKAIRTVFPSKTSHLPVPEAEHYHGDSLGCNQDVVSGSLHHRRKYFSLYNSSPQRKYLQLPSLLELVQKGRRLLELRSQHLPLPDRLLIGWEGLEQAKSQRKTQNRTYVESESSGNVSFEGITEGLNAVFDEKGDLSALGSTLKLQEVVTNLENTKSRLEQRLQTDLVTLKQDRPAAISLKKKHFRVTSKGTNVQTMIWDLERMRLRAERERIGWFRNMLPELEWYRELLGGVVNENEEITPVTYFLMDTVKAVIESGGQDDSQSVIRSALQEAASRDTGVNRTLMSRIAAHWSISPL